MEKFSLKLAANGVQYGMFNHLSKKNLTHGISTRLGGISQTPYHTLNLGIGTKDDRENIWKNRQLFCQALGLDANKAVTACQVHGDNVYTVTEKDIGQQDVFYHTVIQSVDALVTNIPGIALMLFFADCVPVIIYDPVKKAAGVCHAGWRGTVANIAAKTLAAMQKEYQTNPADCLAAIGPSIGPCCYEVDQVVIDSLEQSFPSKILPQILSAMAMPTCHREGDGAGWFLNLWETNRIKLKESGIVENNIAVSSVCTSCNSALYFSHRAENGITGRFGAVVCL